MTSSSRLDSSPTRSRIPTAASGSKLPPAARLMHIALFFSGRIYGYQHSLKLLRDFMERYNPVVFVSLNLDASNITTDDQKEVYRNAQEFAELFGIQEDAKTDDSTEGAYRRSVVFGRDAGRTKFGTSSDRMVMIPTQVPIQFSELCDQVGFHYGYTMYSMHYHNNQCMRMIEEYQCKHNMVFDLVIKHRADVCSASIIENLDEWNYTENSVYVPDLMNFGGCNDQIAIGTFPAMRQYCHFIDHWYDMLTNTELLPAPNRICHETFMMNYLSKFCGLQIRMFTYPYWLDHKRFQHTGDKKARVPSAEKLARIAKQRALRLKGW
jgi:hypothetical protein